MSIPNVISVARIALCPVIAYLALSPDRLHRYAAFAVFVVAALSDVWDGHLARKHGWISDAGKLLDPIADKLLMASAFLPLYFITRRDDGFHELPFWGTLPVWVIAVVFGRELFVTAFRGYAARRGTVIAAGKSGKYKSLVTNFFIGSLLLWYPLFLSATEAGWTHGFWDAWQILHTGFVAVTLAVAVFLTLFSLADYVWRYRSVRAQSR